VLYFRKVATLFLQRFEISSIFYVLIFLLTLLSYRKPLEKLNTAYYMKTRATFFTIY